MYHMRQQRRVGLKSKQGAVRHNLQHYFLFGDEEQKYRAATRMVMYNRNHCISWSVIAQTQESDHTFSAVSTMSMMV